MSAKLPSERSFGSLFSVVFLLAGGYVLYKGFSITWAAGCFVIGVLFLGATVLAPGLLAPLNKAWFALGMLLGKMVNPIVMGIIFFLIITPVALFMKLIGRDALRLRKREVGSYWVVRNPTGPDPESFKNQF